MVIIKSNIKLPMVILVCLRMKTGQQDLFIFFDCMSGFKQTGSTTGKYVCPGLVKGVYRRGINISVGLDRDRHPGF